MVAAVVIVAVVVVAAVAVAIVVVGGDKSGADVGDRDLDVEFGQSDRLSGERNSKSGRAVFVAAASTVGYVGRVRKSEMRVNEERQKKRESKKNANAEKKKRS